MNLAFFDGPFFDGVLRVFWDLFISYCNRHRTITADSFNDLTSVDTLLQLKWSYYDLLDRTVLRLAGRP